MYPTGCYSLNKYISHSVHLLGTTNRVETSYISIQKATDGRNAAHKFSSDNVVLFQSSKGYTAFILHLQYVLEWVFKVF